MATLRLRWDELFQTEHVNSVRGITRGEEEGTLGSDFQISRVVQRGVGFVEGRLGSVIAETKCNTEVLQTSSGFVCLEGKDGDRG